MAITDLSQEMPWWARQGAGPTGGPSAAPQGSGSGAGASSQDWLQYLMQMAGVPQPVQQNGQEQQAPPPADHGDGPTMDQALQIGQNPPAPQPPPNVRTIVQPPAAPAPAPPPAAPAPTPPPGPLAQGPPGYLGSTGATPPLTPGGDPRGPDVAMNQTTGMGGGATNPGYQPPGIAPGRVNPNAPSPAAQPVSAQGPLAGGGASAMGATSNPRFVGIDAPNANPQNSAQRGRPQISALDLSGLFGGGRPAVSNTRVKGPMANGGAPSGDNWDIDADGNVTPNYGPTGGGGRGGPPGRQDMSQSALASAVSKPGWWQGLGRPEMNSDQLGAAVKKRNWYKNL